MNMSESRVSEVDKKKALRKHSSEKERRIQQGLLRYKSREHPLHVFVILWWFNEHVR